MILANTIGDDRHARAVVLAMPHRAVSAYATGERLIDLCVREGLRFPVVPAKAAEGGDVARETLLQIDAEAVLSRDVPRMVGNVWSRNKTSLELSNRVSIDAHVCVVREGQYTEYAGLLRDHTVPQFVLEVLGMHLPRFPDEINSIRNFGHQRLGKTES